MSTRYHLVLDGEDWSDFDSREDALDYADWLVSMPWHAPEAKGNAVSVMDREEGIEIFSKTRTDHRPAQLQRT